MGSDSITALLLYHMNPHQTGISLLPCGSKHIQGHLPLPKFRTFFNKMEATK